MQRDFQDQLLRDTKASTPPAREPHVEFDGTRVVLEDVMPTVAGGLHAAKVTLGQHVQVRAAVYMDGHDALTAELLFRRTGAEAWRQMPLLLSPHEDLGTAAFLVDELGRWEFCVRAWPNPLATWRSRLVQGLARGAPDLGDLDELARALSLYAAFHGRVSTRPPALLPTKIAPAVSAAVNVEQINAARDSVGRALAAKREATLTTELLERVAAVTAWADAAGPMRAQDVACSPIYPLIVDRPVAAYSAWYEFFPRSQTPDPSRHGTLRDAAARLSDIATLGFDVVYLPPIQPIGVTRRKGRNGQEQATVADVGSPWAIGSSAGGFDALHPELGSFEDFEHFTARAAELGLEVALEYALQCSPDHPWVREHPDWFFLRPDGSLRCAENPPHVYQDVYPLNFLCADREQLWRACRDVILFWLGRGVSIFRVDNPHTKPFIFWQWLVADVQQRHPEVVFLSESFTRPTKLRKLAKLGFNQSYTYFTWKNSAAELREHLTELTRGELALYCRPNLFTNTPDVLHAFLQNGGRAAFRVRLLLAATLSPVYGIYSGFELCEAAAMPDSEEYLNSEKFELRVRDWHAAGHIRDDIVTLNRLRRENAALRELQNLVFLESNSENILAYYKSAPENDLIIVVNLDPHNAHAAQITLPKELSGARATFPVTDLLTGASYEWQGRASAAADDARVSNYVRLDPAHAVGHVLRIG